MIKLEREVAFKALVGSHNYNLSTPESDKDYKVFVIPTFEDLYFSKQYSNNTVGDKADYDYHDIRKLVSLFWKSNVNFIEVLYSNDVVHSEDYLIQTFIKAIYKKRDEIVTMNLPYLYRACKGMYFNKMKQLDKGTESTHHLVERYGYSTKEAMHVYRILDFIERFYNNDFTDFKQAIEYTENERKFMLGIKNGSYTRDQFITLVNDKFNTFESLEDAYVMDQPENEKVKQWLENWIYDLVQTEMKYGQRERNSRF